MSSSGQNPHNYTSKAVFLDRDGTINKDTNYVFDPNSVELIPGAAKSIAKLKRAGFLVIVVTNQSCVGRGYATIEEVNATNAKVKELLLREDKDAAIDCVIMATEHPDHVATPEVPHRRKPLPLMLFEAANSFSIDLNSSWIIGDKLSDPMTGINAGLPRDNCILLYPNGEKPNDVDIDCKNSFKTFSTLELAADFLLKQVS